jgi:CDP-glucose 4,6-dehydratase
MKKMGLVTGVDGFVGAHLVKRLLENGYEVVGLCHDVKHKSTLRILGLDSQITRVYGDIRDSKLIKRIIAQYRVERVFHLAAQAIVSVALKDSVSTYDVNCLGTVSLLDACRDQQVESILITSTDKVYGEGLNKKEDDKLGAQGDL